MVVQVVASVIDRAPDATTSDANGSRICTTRPDVSFTRSVTAEPGFSIRASCPFEYQNRVLRPSHRSTEHSFLLGAVESNPEGTCAGSISEPTGHELSPP